MNKFTENTPKTRCFLQISVFVMFYVTQLTKKRVESLLQSPHRELMGFLYWETR